MKRVLLTLLASPALLGSALCYLSVLPSATPAAEAVVQISNNLKCDRASHHLQQQFVCVRVNQATGKTDRELIDLTKQKPAYTPVQSSPDNPDMLDFTDEESDAAISLFGCDCLVCLNSLRQLRAIG